MKKKLSLDLANLRVDSFETVDGAEGRGTVQGLGGSDCYTYSCPPNGTCGASPPSTIEARALFGRTRVELTFCLPCCV
jgi:hypothetical protein